MFNPETFALNLARAMENTGRALSAYLKPRENGERMPGELGEMIKSLYAVADYWMTDQKRAADLQTKLGKSYLDLWASSMKRLAGEPSEPAIQPNPSDKRFQDKEWRSNQFFDFMMQGLSADDEMG